MKDILSVIEISGGIVQHVRSYLPNDQKSREYIEAAEKDFAKVARRLSGKYWVSKKDMDIAWMEGSYSCGNHEVVLAWSEKVTEL